MVVHPPGRAPAAGPGRRVPARGAMPERARYLSGLRSWVGFRQIGVEFDRDARYDDQPRMRLSRLVKLALDAIFGFSRLPLRLALYVGIATSTLSLGVGLWVVYQRLFTANAITGWASTLVSLHFIGGKCLPRWEAARPEWLGQRYLGVIGWVDPGDSARPMGAGYDGILMGGNAVIRRSALDRVGPYSTALSRTGGRLLGCEDEDMYHRLLASGAPKVGYLARHRACRPRICATVGAACSSVQVTAALTSKRLE